ncbi:MAG: hypothetical protein KF768_11740 [Phycisphaeraceae bacterium]|nr:hypothetical protein [Phycisphaeraceae bacterium]
MPRTALATTLISITAACALGAAGLMLAGASSAGGQPASGTTSTTTSSTPAPAQPARPAQAKSLTLDASKFDFMTGRWSSEREGAFVEETWAPAHGDSILGMFRWSNDGKASMFELLSITAEPGKEGAPDVFLRLRHFSSKLEPWKSEPTALTLRYDAANSGPKEALFTADGLPEGAGAGMLHSVRYSSPEPDRFDIVVSFTPDSGREPLEFNLRRADGGR